MSKSNLTVVDVSLLFPQYLGYILWVMQYTFFFLICIKQSDRILFNHLQKKSSYIKLNRNKRIWNSKHFCKNSDLKWYTVYKIIWSKIANKSKIGPPYIANKSKNSKELLEDSNESHMYWSKNQMITMVRYSYEKQ